MTRASAAGLALLALLVGPLGCANRIRYLEPPPRPGPRIRAVPAPLALDWVETRRAGVETNPSREFVTLCAESLREAAVFSDVYEPRRAHGAPAGSFRLGLRITEEIDRRPVANITKVIAILLSGGITGILVPLYLDDRVTVEGELHDPSGGVRAHRVSLAAEIRAFPLAGLAEADEELRGHLLLGGLRAFAAAIASGASVVPRESPTGAPP